MRIDVTQDDIASGEPGDAIRCPIARAIRRVTGCLSSVGTSHVDLFEANGRAHDFELPAEAYNFVTEFDHELPVAPFSFDLPLPEIVINGEIP